MANSGIKVEVGDLVVNEHDAATANVGLYIDGTKVVGAQQATIADAVVAHGAATTAELDALGVKINAILTALEAHGLLASA